MPTGEVLLNAAHAIGDSRRDKAQSPLRRTSDGDTVQIRIEDDGVGITDTVKERMFERFFTTKEAGRGSGQGLAIADEAINSHGGTIEADSTLGVGTTFTIKPSNDEPAGTNPL